jgi:tetratricopeptide (TPR) repeat protein/transcriptional regulator with XRE-family HTH domain
MSAMNGLQGLSLGEFLSSLRNLAGKTQEELAEDSGLSVRSISDLERDRTSRPRQHSLQLLAAALDLDPADAKALIAIACRGPAARQVMARELGTEPGTQLSELYRRILAARTRQAAPVAAAAAAAAGGHADDPVPVIPRELPGAVRHFVGRDDELAALTRLLGQAEENKPGTMVISAIGGTAGVGKTALALHWAHQVARHFPDGQLYVNMHGYDPDQPVTPGTALAGFLRALGVPGQDVPADLEERAARYRSALAGRRVLIVLDNVSEVAQVRPLLPGTPHCIAVVTSRNSLSGLVARDGACRLDLDLLPPPVAVGLLRTLIGTRVDDDPVTAAKLAEQCARLPLALRMAAELAAARPEASLADLTAQLADQRRLLDLLDTDGDPGASVRAVFSWSYQQLDAAAARAFRLASLHPGPGFRRHAFAALTGTTPGQADRVLNLLARASLIQATGSHRYGMHDLLRAYARELAQAQDTDQDRHDALTRLFDHYLHTAGAAMNALFPAERDWRPRVPAPPGAIPAMTDPAAARAWLDTERACLIAATVHMAEHDWPGHAIRLAGTLFQYLDVGSHLPEAMIVHGSALTAARRLGDKAAEAKALTNIGLVHWWQDRYQEATDCFEQALALFGQADDPADRARTLNSLGLCMWWYDRFPEAIGCYEQALALFAQAGNQAGQARTLSNLAMIDYQQGRHRRASERFQEALTLHRAVADRVGEGRDLGNLGAIDLRQGRYQQARSRFEQVLALCEETGDQASQALVLSGLGDLDLRQGRYAEAVDYQRQSLEICQRIRHKSGEAVAINGLGEVSLATGNTADAMNWHAAACDLSAQTGEKRELARAHDGLARACHADGDHHQARCHWEEALALYLVLGAPEADEIRTRLRS